MREQKYLILNYFLISIAVARAGYIACSGVRYQNFDYNIERVGGEQYPEPTTA